jgi:eukaryotic-like serine/threonine-protein kinase
MGDVWRAIDTVLGRPVAIKVLRSHLTADPTFGARFRIEARSIAALHHPGIVSVYDYGEVDQDGTLVMAYLVMAYVDGEPLSARIAAAGQLPPAQTMAIVAQVARALEAAHTAGIIHRDIKPDNLLIDSEGRVILVDFGVARASFAETLTAAGQVVGTARYMAPEQVAKQPLSSATDIYALGAVAYHCLAGHPPFTGDNAISVALNHLQDEPDPLPSSLPSSVRAVVKRAMAKDPARRYASAAAMATAADAAIKDPLAQTLEIATAPAIGAAVPAQAQTSALSGIMPPESIPAASSSGKSRRGLIAAAVLVALLVIGGVIAAVLTSGSGQAGSTAVPPPQQSPSEQRGGTSTGPSGGSSGKSTPSRQGGPGQPKPSSTAGTPTKTSGPTSGPTGTPTTANPTDTASSGSGDGSGDGGGDGSGTGSSGNPSTDPSSGG